MRHIRRSKTRGKRLASKIKDIYSATVMKVTLRVIDFIRLDHRR